MLVLLIPMVLFAFVFLRVAKEKGLPPARFVLFPLVTGSVLAVVCQLLAWGFGALAGGVDRATLHSTVAGLLALVVFFAVNAKAWKQLKSLPSARDPR